MYFYTHKCIYFGNDIKFFSVKPDKKRWVILAYWYTTWQQTIASTEKNKTQY